MNLWCLASVKRHPVQICPDTNQRVLKDSSACRILGTLKNFYGWLLKSQYISADPTIAIELPKLVEPEAQNLDDFTNAIFARSLFGVARTSGTCDRAD